MEENKVIEFPNASVSADNELLNSIGGLLSGSQEGAQFFDELMALSDDQFEIISSIVLESIAHELNEPNTKMVLAQSLTIGGYSIEELNTQLQGTLNALDGALTEYSEPKRMFMKSILVMICNAINETEGIAKKIIEVPIELGENAKMPQYATDGSAAVDLYSPAEYTIEPGQTVLIPVNIKTALPKGYAFLIHPRSGLSYKSKMRVCNSIGLIDSDYRDTIGVLIENIEPKIKDLTIDDEGRVTSIEYGKSYTIGAGERFAQMRLVEVPKVAFCEMESVADIGENREGGFGHTGKE